MRRRRTTETMSMKNPSPRQAAPETTDAPTFGVDADGRLHRYDTHRETIFVTDRAGRVTHAEEAVPREQVPLWIQYVDDSRGWVDQWWHDDFGAVFGRLSAALEEVDRND